MLSKTSFSPSSKLTGVSAPDARRAFERSIARIGQAGPLSPAQLPIAVRRRETVEAGSSNEKQALTDAARALAQLWKVSPALVR